MFACFPLLLLLSSIAAYYKITLGQSITPMVIELTVTNDLRTWATMISPLLIVLSIVAIGLGIVISIYRYMRVGTPKHSVAWVVAALVVLMSPFSFIPRINAPVSARVPMSFFSSYADYLKKRRAVVELRTTFDTIPVSPPIVGPDVIFVIGESLRPDHLQINGYHRATTPNLMADTAVVSFPNMHSLPFFTHSSVPFIVSRADTLHPDLGYCEQSFITLFKRAGYRTSWISNQDAVDSYAYFMNEADTLIQCNSTRSLYDYQKWLDSDLLEHVDDVLEEPTSEKLIVLHTIGSHWWYPSHYPDSLAVFKPEVNSRIVSELTREQMVNSYDNTIVATDRLLADLIARLRDRTAIMIFVSDHGEALGEDGHFLHAGDYPQLHDTAALVWCSPKYTALFPGKVANLRKNADKELWTDVMFHSALDAAGISTPALNPELSIFR